MSKQALITMIAGRLENKGCHVVHAEGDADVDIVKAAITMSSFQSTTLIGEDTDLLVLLLFYAESSSHDLYFRSDKNKDKFRVYNIKILKQLFGTDICSVLLLAHAFSGSDTTSRIFGVGKKSVFHKVVIGDPVMHACAKTFCSPESEKDDIETNGCKAMVSLFGGSQTDLGIFRLQISFKESSNSQELC